ncbi:hypothetical protein [Ruania alba]|uniref:Uncharacterized protein n=1 Tax=Ruania alba TaxID=648782 RepID=A0A1H5N5T5_9MICO|nr:hypothetical protein [Ruania alba]SEE96257.1 hypothetical protein SAMN04488554_3914 [Ruania alba]
MSPTIHPVRARRCALGAVGLTALLAVGAGCSPAPTVGLDGAPDPAPPTDAVAEDVSVLLTDVARAFGTNGAPTDVISDGAGIAIATTELTDALDLGDQPAAVAAGLAHTWSLLPAARQVTVEVITAEVVGTHQGDPVARLDVETEVASAGAPTQVSNVDYLAAWDGGRLTLLTPAGESDGAVALDSGVGLESPTGAVRRYLDLVEAGEWAAVEQLAEGINVDRTALEVLGTTVADAEAVEVVRVVAPEGPDGEGAPAIEGGQVVYAVSGADQILGRFGVDVAQRLVVYERTD